MDPTAPEPREAPRLIANPLARPSPRGLTTLGHVRAQHGVHPRLIPWTLRLEPVQNIGVDAKRDRLLRRGLDDLCVVPEILREIRQLSGGRRPNLSLGDAPESSQIGAATLNPATSC